jgi:two-component system nitrogen regulation response regulator GlnG
VAKSTAMEEEDPSTIITVREPVRDAGDLRAVGPALTIVWHHDLRRVGQAAPMGPGTTEISRKTPPFDMVTDVALSRSPFLVVDFRDGAAEIRRTSTLVAVDVEGAPLDSPRWINAGQLTHGIIITIADSMVVCLHLLRTPVLRGPTFGLVGGSDAIEAVRRKIAQVADLDVSTLLRGESGTGKELVAHAIAKGSGRGEPLVDVNMTTIPPAMAPAELFGHEKGAFTGATESRPGYFVMADGGTLFLDEIGGLSLEIQQMLLRALETWDVRPIGGRRSRRVNVRVISATDTNLEEAVAQGRFSEALFERLAGFQIRLPPLRARREDIGPLLLHFLRKSLAMTDELERLEPREPSERPWLSARNAARIAGSPFPGNIRRLRNVAGQLVISNRGRPFAEIDDTVADLLVASAAPSSARTHPRPTPQGRVTDDEIQEALLANNYNYSAAAEALGIHRSTLYDRTRANPQGLRTAAEISDDEVLDAHKRFGGDMAGMARELRCSPKPLKTRVSEALKRRSGR